MVISTGEGSDLYFFNPTSPTRLWWRDEGGTDILALVNSEWLDDRQIAKTDNAIVVRIDGSTLVIPHDEEGEPSIEILEWRLPDNSGSPTQVQTRLGIVTDPAGLIGAGQVFVGSKADDTVTAPKSGKTISGSFTDIFGAGGDDMITLSPSYETRAFGGWGHDTIVAMGSVDTTQIGNDGNDKLTGADGDDHLEGGRDNDIVKGGAGRDYVDGGRGRDILKGGLGNDMIYGDGISFGAMPGGRDRIFGGAGNDYIQGGQGRDIMRGGKGADVFEWDIAQLGDGDVIKDFDATQDRLQLDTHTVRGRLKARVEDGDTIVSFRGSDMVLLEDVSLKLSQIDIDLL